MTSPPIQHPRLFYDEDARRWANAKRKTEKDDALKLARVATMRELNPVLRGDLDEY